MDRNPHWLIIDRAQLWRDIEAHILVHCSQAKFRKMEQPIDPAEFRRLRLQMSGTISERVFGVLLAAVPQDDERAAREALLACIVLPNEQVVLTRAKYWQRAQTGVRAPYEPPIPIFRDGRLEFLDPNHPVQRTEWERHMAQESKALEERVEHVLPAYSFKAPGSLAYHLVVWQRVLSPLLRWEESGFTERHWFELSDSELREFVRAGLSRENVLNDRVDELTRVRTALEGRVPLPRSNAEVPDEVDRILDDLEVGEQDEI